MNYTPNELRDQLVKDFGAAWMLNDPAHRQEHFEDVYQAGILITKRLGMYFPPQLIMLAAYFHDMFAWSRFNHHLMSAKWIETTDYPIITDLSPDHRRLVAEACGEHRASYKGEFSSPFAELINTADRGVPGTAESLVERSILYTAHHNPDLSPAEVRAMAVQHIKDKFGRNGYTRYTSMYVAAFGPELEKMFGDIDNLKE